MSRAHCQSIQDQLTAWIDGELKAGESARVGAHVEECPLCTAETANLRRTVGLQRAALRRLMAVDDLDVSTLSARLDRVLTGVDGSFWVRWNAWGQTLRYGRLRPVMFAGAAIAAVAFLSLFLAGGPEAVLIPLGVEPPPAAVSRQPDLFKDYMLIQHLEALENFDTVESTPLDDDQTSQRG